MTKVLRSLRTRWRLTLGVGLVAVIAAVALVLALGRGEPPAAAGPPTPSPTPSPTPDVEPEPLGAAPLTGTEIFDETVLERPVVAVKVENSRASRPQTGLEDADIVYEELVEGGVTRFLALYQSVVPERVGPIRSARPEDADLLAPFNTFLFSSGGRAETVSRLRAAGVPWIREDGTVMVRDRSRRSPHNVYAGGDAMFDYASERVGAAAPMPWRFDEEAPDGHEPCPEPCEVDPGEHIAVAMSSSALTAFEYDAQEGVYRRDQNGEPHLVTGEGRIGAANVVVIGTWVGDGGCCDSAGSRYTATRIVGDGDAIVLRDGRRYAARWSKPASGSHHTLTTPTGEPFPLKPGPTWILLAPERALR